jgi:hypothetical protein
LVGGLRAGDKEAFTNLFSPAKIPGQICQVLGWYVIRKGTSS